MKFTKDQSEYLEQYDFNEGLPKGSTEKMLLKINNKMPIIEFIPPPGINMIAGIKNDLGKSRFDLIPADALEEVAKIYTIGANKYGDRNWEKGLSYGRLFGAMLRHAWAWWRGERDDKENKLHHLSSVIFNALGLLHYELNSEKFKHFDDRK